MNLRCGIVMRALQGQGVCGGKFEVIFKGTTFLFCLNVSFFTSTPELKLS